MVMPPARSGPMTNGGYDENLPDSIKSICACLNSTVILLDRGLCRDMARPWPACICPAYSSGGSRVVEFNFHGLVRFAYSIRAGFYGHDFGIGCVLIPAHHTTRAIIVTTRSACRRSTIHSLIGITSAP